MNFILSPFRMLRLAYPAAVLAAALMAWATAVRGSSELGSIIHRPPRMSQPDGAGLAISMTSCSAGSVRWRNPGPGSCSAHGGDLTDRRPASF